MNRSWLLGLLVGLLVGFVVAAAVLATRSSAREAEKAKEAAAREADGKKSERAWEDERTRLTARITDLEKASRDLAAQTVDLEKQLKASKDASPATADAPRAKPDLAAKFSALAEKGLAAYGSPDFQELAKLVKEGGKEAIELLARSLLKGAKSGERFIAAALLEAAGDAAAIPALSEALKSDADLMVRRMASHAIAVIGTEAAESPLRGAMTGDQDWGVRVNSAYGVAKLGREDGLAMLQNAYASADTPAMYRAAILGGLADVAAPSTAPLFRKILSDTKDETFLFMAIGALAKMKDEASRPDLERVASSELPESIREAARKALEQFGK
jgi:HEAT repeat protein